MVSKGGDLFSPAMHTQTIRTVGRDRCAGTICIVCGIAVGSVKRPGNDDETVPFGLCTNEKYSSQQHTIAFGFRFGPIWPIRNAITGTAHKRALSEIYGTCIYHTIVGERVFGVINAWSISIALYRQRDTASNTILDVFKTRARNTF